MTEDDTCRRYVLPNLHSAGWADERILGQRYFTDGRIIPAGRKHVRKAGKKADYLLLYRPDYPPLSRRRRSTRSRATASSRPWSTPRSST